MENIKAENRLFNSRFAVFLAIYLISSFFLQWYYRYEGINANTIGYFTVALEYARGNFSNAINGFFPPLISWLLVPFIKLGVNPLIALRVLNVVTGLFFLIGVGKLSYRLDISESIRNIVLFSSVPIVLYYTTYLFPDLLASCFLIYYLNIIFNNKYPHSIYNGLICGGIGAIAYLSKNYALPFFIAHFLLFNALHFLRNTTKIEKKKILQNVFVGILLFSTISGIWVSLISSKYNFFTIGTAGDYGARLVGPEMQAVPEFYETQSDDPVYYVGLLKPSYENAISAWDDPTTTFMSENFLSKKKLWDDPKYLIKHMSKNVIRVVQIIFVNFFSFLSIPIIIAYILFCIQPPGKLILRGDILYPFATLILYSTGLTPFIVHIDNVRYFWIDNILLLLMGGQVLTVLFRNVFFKNTRKIILIVFFILSFIVIPVRDITQKPVRGERNYALFQKLKADYNIQGNIASNDNWGFTLELVYHLNLNKSGKRIYYYGMPKKNQSDEALLGELKSNNIDYYFVWGKNNSLLAYKDITEGRIVDLKIYSLKERRNDYR